LPQWIAAGSTFGGSLSPDGRELYFNTMTADRKTMTMLVSRFDGSAWGAPAPLAFSTGPRDIDPFVTPDGRHLLFESDRARGNFDVWIADREGAGWSAPHPVDAVNTDENEVFATQSAAGEMVFGRAAQTTGRPRPVVFSYRPGEAPRPLPATINDGYTTSNPLIAPDGSFLIFVSDRPGGLGDTDLWVSFRDGETWRAPRNLGPPIDTADGEFAPGLSADGAWLFFTRRHDGQNVVQVVRAPGLLRGR
jgi:Tol biopolymer transport system component